MIAKAHIYREGYGDVEVRFKYVRIPKSQYKYPIVINPFEFYITVYTNLKGLAILNGNYAVLPLTAAYKRH